MNETELKKAIEEAEKNAKWKKLNLITTLTQ